MSQWRNDIHQGDAVETLTEMPESSVHCVMTSPPYYGLRNYDVSGQIGLEESLSEYIAELVAVGDALTRVLRDDGSWWLNLGDSYSGSWGGQSHDSDENTEAASTPKKNRARNTQLGRKNKMLVPHRVAISLQESGWVVRNDVTWQKPDPMPSSVTDRLNTTTEQVFHLTPQPDYWYDLDAIREPHQTNNLAYEAQKSSKWGKKKEQTSKPNVEDYREETRAYNAAGKNPGDVFEVTTQQYPDSHFAVYPSELCETPIKSSCPPKTCAECGTPYERETEESVSFHSGSGKAGNVPSGKHADKQEANSGDYDIRMGPKKTVEHKGWNSACECATDDTEPGVVLDPFAGAGTTCLVAKRLNRQFIGVDLNPEYVAIAQKRVGLTVDDPERLTEDNETTLNDFTDTVSE